MKFVLKYIAVLIGCIFLFNCSGSRLIKRSKVECVERNLTNKEIKHYRDTGHLNYKWLKLKADVEATIKGESYSFTASLRLKKDSIIWCSISKAGLPIAKIKVTTDSLKMVDSFNKKYMKGSVKEIEAFFKAPLTLTAFQKVLLSEFYVNDTVKFKSWKKGDKYIISSRPRLSTNKAIKKDNPPRKPIAIQWVSCDRLNLTKMLFKDPQGRKVTVDYGQLSAFNTIELFKEISFKVFEQQKETSNIKLLITRVKPFDQLNVPFVIPSDYAEME